MIMGKTLVAAALAAAAATPSHGQYLGLKLRGDTGLLSGSQPVPGVYFVLPLYYRSDESSVRTSDGSELPGDVNANIALFAPAIAVTTKWKVLGATYGFQVVPPFMRQRLTAVGSRIDKSNSYGFADLFVQPISLGWRLKHADFMAGYGFYAPTGSGDRSLDMWVHELIGGTSVFFDADHKWHVSGTVYYDINQRKRSNDIKVGDFLTWQGGAGRSLFKGAGSVGVAYLAQWKMTRDTGTDIGPLLAGGKNKAIGFGPEVNVPFLKKGSVVGLIGARYMFEVKNVSNFQGQNLILSLTIAKIGGI